MRRGVGRGSDEGEGRLCHAEGAVLVPRGTTRALCRILKGEGRRGEGGDGI